MIKPGAILQFSGGKDSLACLAWLEPFLDIIRVVWVNTGAAVDETIMTTKRIPNLIEIKSNQPADIAKNGFPTDILPLSRTAFGQEVEQHNKPAWRYSADCCMNNLWLPMQEAMELLKPTQIIRGQRLAERRKSPIRSGDIINGIEYIFPLENWTDSDVINYLREKNIELPSYYEYGSASIDCWDCTAYLYDAGRLEFLKNVYPEKYKIVMSRLDDLRPDVERELRWMS